MFVKANNGVLLQGTSPNRYVEVDISYQPAANIPHAFFSKDAGASISSVFESFAATTERKVAKEE